MSKVKKWLCVVLLGIIAASAAYTRENSLNMVAGTGVDSAYLDEWKWYYLPLINHFIGPPSVDISVVVKVDETILYTPAVFLLNSYPDLGQISIRYPVMDQRWGADCFVGNVNICLDYQLTRLTVGWAYKSQLFGIRRMPYLSGSGDDMLVTELIARHLAKDRPVKLSPDYGLAGLDQLVKNGKRQIFPTDLYRMIVATQAEGKSRDWLSYDFLSVIRQLAYEIWRTNTPTPESDMAAALLPLQRAPIDDLTVHDWDAHAMRFTKVWDIPGIQIELYGALYDDWSSSDPGYLIPLPTGKPFRYVNGLREDIIEGQAFSRILGLNRRIIVEGPVDLANPNASKYLSKFPHPGAYKIEVAITSKGETGSDYCHFAISPPAAEIIPNGNRSESDGIFAIIVDGAEDVVDEYPSVENGKVVWYQNGLAFIQPHDFTLPKIIKINGKPFTLPLPWTRMVTVPSLASQGAPRITAVVSSSSFNGGKISPREHATIFGERLTSGKTSADWLTPKFEMEGTSVKVCGIPSRLIYVSPSQINFVTPSGITPGGLCDVSVTTAAGTTTHNGIPVATRNLSLFLFTPSQNGILLPPLGIITDAQYNLLGPPVPGIIPPLTQPKCGDVILLWANGGGIPYPDDQNTPATGLLTMSPLPTVAIEGINARVDWAGLVPTLSALYQINVVVPCGLPPRDPQIPYQLVLEGGAVYSLFVRQQ